jgi:hypothetical protein
MNQYPFAGFDTALVPKNLECCQKGQCCRRRFRVRNISGLRAMCVSGAAIYSAYALPMPGKLTNPNTWSSTLKIPDLDATASPETSQPMINPIHYQSFGICLALPGFGIYMKTSPYKQNF